MHEPSGVRGSNAASHIGDHAGALLPSARSLRGPSTERLLQELLQTADDTERAPGGCSTPGSDRQPLVGPAPVHRHEVSSQGEEWDRVRLRVASSDV